MQLVSRRRLHTVERQSFNGHRKNGRDREDRDRKNKDRKDRIPMTRPPYLPSVSPLQSSSAEPASPLMEPRCGTVATHTAVQA